MTFSGVEVIIVHLSNVQIELAAKGAPKRDIICLLVSSGLKSKNEGVMTFQDGVFNALLTVLVSQVY